MVLMIDILVLRNVLVKMLQGITLIFPPKNGKIESCFSTSDKYS